MKVDLGIWGKLTKLIVLLLVLSGILAVAIWYRPLIQQNERMRKRILELEAQIKEEEETSKNLHGSIDAIRTDPKTVERLAIERLGYAKPGESVIRFESPPTNPASARP